MTLISFIGGGNMAQALGRGLKARGGYALRASDPDADQRARLDALGIESFADNHLAIAGADAIVLAIKPQVLLPIAQALPAEPGQLVISIAAGITLDQLARCFPAGQPIVRCMPNTPALVGQGVSGLYADDRVSSQQRALTTAVLEAVGSAYWVPTEAHLDAVIAVSGSGPAYFFYLLEAMIEAGQELGLDASIATALATETALGAARMALESGDDPATLRRKVTSPGGTTQAALETLDAAGVKSAVHDALASAVRRAQTMAKDND